MRIIKRAAAAVTAAVLAAAMSGCSSSTDYAMTVNGKKINAGVYINFLMTEMSNQMYTLYYGGEITDPSECFDKQIDGKDFAVYVKDEALANTKELAAIDAKFTELGLTLSEEDMQTVEDSIDASWDESSGYYENLGISRDSLTQCSEMSYKRQAIFDYYYGEGGEKEVTADDLQAFVDENYIRYKTVTVYKSTAEDSEEAEAENAELKELVEGYLAEAEELDFAGFDEIIDEYAAYEEQQAAEESGDTADTETDTDTDSEETAETQLDSASDSDADSDLDSDSAEDSAADSDTDSDTDTDTDSEETEESEEEDPYANETVVNYTEALDTESEYYSESEAEMLTEFKSAEYGTAAIYETDDAYYLYMTEDIADRSDYAEENRDELLDSMKGEEFEETVAQWVEALEVSVNQKAVQRYAVKDIYDRQNDYYSSNAG